jgi:hypothetical protein
MKRVLSIMLIAALVVMGTLGMCFAEGTDAYVTFSIIGKNTQTVTGDISFDISTDVFLSAQVGKTDAKVTSLTIINRTEDVDLAVTTVSAAGEDGWSVVTDEEVKNAEKGEKLVCLSMEGEDLSEAGYAVQDGTIADGETRVFPLGGSIAPQPAAMEAFDVATLTVTVAKADGA